jgi:hypothetical protein
METPQRDRSEQRVSDPSYHVGLALFSRAASESGDFSPEVGSDFGISIIVA